MPAIQPDPVNGNPLRHGLPSPARIYTPISRDPQLVVQQGAPLQLHARGANVLIFVTAYNENMALVKGTLDGILDNLATLAGGYERLPAAAGWSSASFAAVGEDGVGWEGAKRRHGAPCTRTSAAVSVRCQRRRQF